MLNHTSHSLSFRPTSCLERIRSPATLWGRTQGRDEAHNVGQQADFPTNRMDQMLQALTDMLNRIYLNKLQYHNGKRRRLDTSGWTPLANPMSSTGTTCLITGLSMHLQIENESLIRSEDQATICKSLSICFYREALDWWNNKLDMEVRSLL